MTSCYSTKVCQRCGREYQPTSGTQKHCSECGPVANAIRIAGWERANPGRHAARTAKWIKENPEKHEASSRASSAKWYKTHPEKDAVKKSKRRALKYDNTPISEMLISTEWLAILAEHNGRCHYCGKKAKLTLDHVYPLSRGGRHSKDNVVPACIHCNDSKGVKTLEEWRFLLSVEA